MATYKECKTLKFPGSDIIYVITDDGKVAVSQGIENAGKILGVGEDGSVTLIDAKNLETEIPAELLTYIEQTLTEEQKTQARANIGAGTSDFSGSYDDLTNKPELFSGNYDDLENKPTLFSGDYNDLKNKPVISSVDVDDVLSNTSTNPVQNKVIYNALGQMATTEYVTTEISSAIGTAIGGSY